MDLERSLKGERATSLSFPAGRPEPGTSSRASRVSPADPTPDSAPFPPASGVGDKAASSYAVPIVDLSNPDETAVADALWDAATTVGFFTVVGHGIDEESIDAQFEASREFFEQDLAVKEAASPFEPALNSGFEHMKQVRPSTGLPDVKESLQVTARADAMSGRWPPKPAEFEARTRAFMTKSHALAARILTLLEPRACPGNAPGTLADAHTLWGPDGQCTLRHLHYPPMSAARHGVVTARKLESRRAHGLVLRHPAVPARGRVRAGVRREPAARRHGVGGGGPGAGGRRGQRRRYAEPMVRRPPPVEPAPRADAGAEAGDGRGAGEVLARVLHAGG